MDMMSNFGLRVGQLRMIVDPSVCTAWESIDGQVEARLHETRRKPIFFTIVEPMPQFATDKQLSENT